MITITLRQILDNDPCYDPRDCGFLPHDHDLDAPIAFREIVAVVDLDDALWCLQAAPEYEAIARRFALGCAERVRRFMADPRSTNALDVTSRHLAGEASDDELDASNNAAWTAARDAAWYAARVSSSAVPWAAASDAASSARDAASYAASVAATNAEMQWQAALLIDLTEQQLNLIETARDPASL